MGNSNSMLDSGSDASHEDISGEQHACIENYRDLLQKPDTRNHYLSQRIYQAELRFGQLMTTLCDDRMDLRTRVVLLEKNVRSRLCYATGMWNLGQAEMLRLQQVYAQFLYRMIGRNRTPETPEFTSASAYQIQKFKEKSSYRIAATTPLYFHLLKLRLEWIAYCLNSGKRNEAKFLLFGENDKKQRMIFENLARDPKIALNRIQLQYVRPTLKL